MPSYAVIQTGGKQYRVQPGDVIDVETLDQEVGARVDFPHVLLVDADGAVSVGTPSVDGARVTAEVADQFRGPKIIVYKYKAKTHYRRKNGHRQSYTRLRIRHILTDGADEPAEVVADAVQEAPAPRRRRRSTRAAAAAPETPAAEETAQEPVAAAEAAEAPAEESPAEESAETPAEESPAEESAEAPAEESPPEESAEAGAEESPAEESAETPAEESPPEESAEAPTEESPAEESAEAPAEESLDGGEKKE